MNTVKNSSHMVSTVSRELNRNRRFLTALLIYLYKIVLHITPKSASGYNLHDHTISLFPTPLLQLIFQAMKLIYRVYVF